MFHKTTLNFHYTTMLLLDELAEMTGLSRRLIVIQCLNKIATAQYRHMPSFLSQVKYQKADPGKKKWHKFHVRLKASEYEYFVGVRFVFRMSSSFILALAIKRFYDDVMNDDVVDGRFILDVIAFEAFFNKGTQTWVQHWGIPEKLCDDRDNSPRL